MSDNHFDRSELIERLGGDEELLRELLDMANEDFPSYLTSLESACGADDSEQFRRAAHKLKGFARNLAFNQLAELALSAEKSADIRETDCQNYITAIDGEITILRSLTEK